MAQYIIRRMMWNALVLVVISMITFGLMHAVPGGPFDKEKALPEEIMTNLEERYHLDEPLPMQYAALRVRHHGAAHFRQSRRARRCWTIPCVNFLWARVAGSSG